MAGRHDFKRQQPAAVNSHGVGLELGVSVHVTGSDVTGSSASSVRADDVWARQGMDFHR
jgi:hypothetical protein